MDDKDLMFYTILYKKVVVVKPEGCEEFYETFPVKIFWGQRPKCYR